VQFAYPFFAFKPAILILPKDLNFRAFCVSVAKMNILKTLLQYFLGNMNPVIPASGRLTLYSSR
jgi:hypothetical protein